VGNQVTITGTNFSSTTASNTVTFNGTEATLTSASTTQLVTTVPSGATSGPVNVEVGGQTATGPNFTVTAGQALSITSDSTFTVEENSTAVGTITANGPNGDDLTFSLSGGADQGQFSIDGTSGALSFNTAPDFEAPADDNSDNVYQVEVSVSDGSQSASQPLTITVTDVDENQAPTITSDAAFDVEENQTAVGTITANDPDGDDLTFSLSGGDDQGQFSIDGTSGALSFNTAPDFEAPADGNADNDYQVQVQASDGTANTMQDVTVTITNLNDNAPVITSDAALTGTEGQTAAATITATDSDGSTLTFSLSGGADQDDFTIDSGSGALSFNAAPDFDNPEDANADNTYELQVQVSDGVATAGQSLTVTIEPFAGGDGSAGAPYQVGTLAQLQRVGDFLSDNFEQTADIDASATASQNNGAGFAPIGINGNPFTGRYDGGGFAISGLTIDRPINDVGLFGVMGSGASIENVALNDADITGNRRVGGLVGFNNNDGSINNSHATGSVSGVQGVGGLVGLNNAAGDVGSGGTITNSYATGSVSGEMEIGGLAGLNAGTISESYATGSVSGSVSDAQEIGGLVGQNDNTIANSYATGSVTGDRLIGGLAGVNFLNITTSYATGSVSGNQNIGGLVGADNTNPTPPDPPSVTEDSYWDTQSTGQTNSRGGTGLETAEMQGTAAQANMVGFDFDNVWLIQTNPDDYPILRGVAGQ
jgi:hypothetical protein